MADFIFDDALIEELFRDGEEKENSAAHVKGPQGQQWLPPPAAHLRPAPAHFPIHNVQGHPVRASEAHVPGSGVHRVQSISSVSAQGRADQIAVDMSRAIQNGDAPLHGHNDVCGDASRHGDYKPMAQTSRTNAGITGSTRAPAWQQQAVQATAIPPAHYAAAKGCGVNMQWTSASVAAPFVSQPHRTSINAPVHSQQYGGTSCPPKTVSTSSSPFCPPEFRQDHLNSQAQRNGQPRQQLVPHHHQTPGFSSFSVCFKLNLPSARFLKFAACRELLWTPACSCTCQHWTGCSKTAHSRTLATATPCSSIQQF